MRYFLFFPVITFILLSCNSESNNSSLPSDTSGERITQQPDTLIQKQLPHDTMVLCYRYDNGDQHNWMEMTRIGDTAYGELHYTREGKGGANGPFPRKLFW